MFCNDYGTIFHCEQGQQCCLFVKITCCNFVQIYNRRISECSVTVFDCCLTDLNCIFECLFYVCSGYIDHQILVSKTFQLFYCIVDFRQICSAYAKYNTCCCGNSVHCFVVGSICTIQDRFSIFAYFQCCFCNFCILTVKDQNTSCLCCFFHQLNIILFAICTVIYIYHLNEHTLADTFIINFFNVLKFLCNRLIIHACAKRHCISCSAYECFFMTEQNGFATQRQLCIACTNFDCFHWRLGSC